MRCSRLLLALGILSTADLVAQNPPPAAARTPPRTAHATSPAATQIQKRLETYLRRLYAWGPSFRVNVGTFKDAPVPGFYEVSVEVIQGAQTDSGIFYVSKDGRYLLRGDMQDMTADPLAQVRSQIRLANNPSKGPENARVSVVEYSDFQCPSCRKLHETLKAVVPNYPQVRFVFKDFPLSQIHPWAMTAALAGRCAYVQNLDAFWKLHDSIFDNQENISTENVWQKMVEFAAPAGLDPATFRSCMASSEAKQAVQDNLKEGQGLKIANTPTVFVNGRRLVGWDRGLLEQYIQYELAQSPPPKP